MACNTRATVKECIDFLYQKNIVDIDYAYDHIGCIYNYVSNADFTEKVQEAINVVIRMDEDGYYLHDDIHIMGDILRNEEDLSLYVVAIAKELSKLILHLMYRHNRYHFCYSEKQLNVIVFGIMLYMLLRNTRQDDIDEMCHVLVSIYHVNHKAHNISYIYEELCRIYRWTWLKRLRRCTCERFACIAIKEFEKSTQKLKNAYDEAKKIVTHNHE